MGVGLAGTHNESLFGCLDGGVEALQQRKAVYDEERRLSDGSDSCWSYSGSATATVQVLGKVHSHFSVRIFKEMRHSGFRCFVVTKDLFGFGERGSDVLLISLDVAGAFDRVWHAGLIKKL